MKAGLAAPERGGWMVPSNALARLRQEREAHAVSTGPAPEQQERPKFLGLQADPETSPEQEAVRRIIARLGDEGPGLGEGEQRALAKALVAAEAGDLPRAGVTGCCGAACGGGVALGAATA